MAGKFIWGRETAVLPHLIRERSRGPADDNHYGTIYEWLSVLAGPSRTKAGKMSRHDHCPGMFQEERRLMAAPTVHYVVHASTMDKGNHFVKLGVEGARLAKRRPAQSFPKQVPNYCPNKIKTRSAETVLRWRMRLYRVFGHRAENQKKPLDTKAVRWCGTHNTLYQRDSSIRQNAQYHILQRPHNVDGLLVRTSGSCLWHGGPLWRFLSILIDFPSWNCFSWVWFGVGRFYLFLGFAPSFAGLQWVWTSVS